VTRLGWDGRVLAAVAAVDAVDQTPPPVVADSWLVADGAVRALERHERRFADAAGPVPGFLEAVRLALPRTGRWFPRIELSDGLYLWLREAPALGSSARLWVDPEPDRRFRPSVKGADLELLGRLRVRAHEHGADEPVLLDRAGRVLEGASTSLLWWRGDVLCLPPAAGRLDGVTSQLLVEGVRAAGGQVRFEAVRPVELAGLEVWAVNALHGLRPVSGWADGMPVGDALRAGAWSRYLDAAAVPLT
jgi:hypothetical protein